MKRAIGRTARGLAAEGIARTTLALAMILVLATSHVQLYAQGDDAPVEAQGDGDGVEATPEKMVILKPGADPGRIELHVKDQDLKTVLKMLAQHQKVNIVAGKNVSGKVSCDLYNVGLEETLDVLLRANGCAFRREGQFITVYTQEELDAILLAEKMPITRIFVLDFLNAAEAESLIKPVLSDKAIIAVSSPAESGIPSGGDEVGGDSYSHRDCVVVTDYEENIEAAAQIIKGRDIRPLQVLVEATILEVTLDEDNKLGIDFNVLAGVDFRDMTGVTTASIVDPTALGGGANTTSLGNVPFGQAHTQGFAAAGDGLNIGVLTSNVAFFINALENVTDTNILSNPKVLVLNKQRAEVIVGERLGYLVQTTTETATTTTVEFLDTGTRLTIRPFVSRDGHIRMEVHPEVSTGVVSPEGLPSKTTTEVTCNIMIKDGNTIVIGGLIKESSFISRKQVPGLGNIPGLGVLFRSKADDTLRKEIIILLTPHIIKDEEANAEGSRRLRGIKRRLGGLREKFAFYSRERLTKAHMEAARKHMRQFKGANDEASLDK
ncbi:MAG: hypothetical protein QF662_02705, partial [Phycisphaerae bacterium]|nr:hypothetical protein [Phycisphaerae bacterium]